MLHATQAPLASWTHAVLDRLTLAANHVLGAEPAAAARLRPHAGRLIDARPLLKVAGPAWMLPGGSADSVAAFWRITPAGLLERVESTPDAPQNDLAPHVDATLSWSTDSLTQVVAAWAADDTSIMQISPGVDSQNGPVDTGAASPAADPAANRAAFITDLRWVVDNLRWDFAGDLERVLPSAVGAPLARAAEVVTDGVKRGVVTLAGWLPSRPPRG